MFKIIGVVLITTGLATAFILLALSALNYSLASFPESLGFGTTTPIENCILLVSRRAMPVPDSEGFTYHISLSAPSTPSEILLPLPNATQSKAISVNMTAFLLTGEGYLSLSSMLRKPGVKPGDIASLLSREAVVKASYTFTLSISGGTVETTPVGVKVMKIPVTLPSLEIKLPAQSGVYNVTLLSCVTGDVKPEYIPFRVTHPAIYAHVVAQVRPTVFQYLRSIGVACLGFALYVYDALRHRYGYSRSRIASLLDYLEKLKHKHRP